MMRWKFAVLAMVLVFGGSASGDRPATRVKQFQIDMRLWQGDPLGTRAAGTVKLLSEPRIVTSDSQEAMIHSGGQTKFDGQLVPFGHTVRIVPESTNDSKIKLRVVLDYSEIEEGGASAHSTQSRYVRTVAEGETVKLRFGKVNDRPADKQTWAEIAVREVR